MTIEDAVARATALADGHIKRALESVRDMYIEKGATAEELEAGVAEFAAELDHWKSELIGDVRRLASAPDAPSPSLN